MAVAVIKGRLKRGVYLKDVKKAILWSEETYTLTSGEWLASNQPFLVKRTDGNKIDQFSLNHFQWFYEHQFYPWCKLAFLLFKGMVMYDSEFETKGNRI